MAEIFTMIAGSLFGGGTAAAGAGAVGGAGAAVGAAGAAAGGISAASILQGATGILSMVASIGAGQAEAEQYELAADDAAREVPLETLQGINRRTSIKQAMMEQLGEQDVAYAASGTDLSFGTPAQARKEAFREADLALTTDVGTEQTRVARLREREVNYRKRASKAKSAGFLTGVTTGLSTMSSISNRGR
jgi:hypothetical protein